MARGFRPRTGAMVYNTPRWGEVWLVVDRNQKHNGTDQEYENSIQGGTRTCVVVSNNTGNRYSPNVEIVYTTTREKADLPTHFLTISTPEPSTVLCEEIMTVPKKDLTKFYGALSTAEQKDLKQCLKISLGLE